MAASKLFRILGRQKKPALALVQRAKPKLPRTERVMYTAKINAFWNLWSGFVHSQFHLHKIRRDDLRADAVELFTATYQQLLENSKLGDFIEGLGNRVVGKAVGYMRKVVKVPAVMPGREHMLQEFRDRNIALIKNLGAEQAQKLNELLQNANAFNVRHEDLAPKVQDILDVGESRAELIARDQTLKINAQAHQIAQTSAGVEEYVWSTSEDEKVRDSHQVLDGTTHGWDDPPEVDGELVHPGEAINCRCVPVPRIPLLDDI